VKESAMNAEKTSYSEADAARPGLLLSAQSGEDEGPEVDPSEEPATDGSDYSGDADEGESSESPGSIGGGGTERTIRDWGGGYAGPGDIDTEYPGDVGGGGSER